MFTANKDRYGNPKITRDLKAQGVNVSRPRAAKLMKQANLKSVIQRKYVVITTDSKHTYPVAENYLNRQFNLVKPGKVWVSYLTYTRTREGWLYLTMIMDLYDQKVIGWALSTPMKAAETTIPAWQMAIENWPIERELIFHSDRGVQYACHDLTSLLKKHPLVVQGMTGPPVRWERQLLG